MKVINVGVYPPPFGGVSVHLKRLLEYLHINKQDALLIDISTIPKYEPDVINYKWWKTIWFLLTSVHKYIVHFHNFSLKNTFFYYIISFRHKTILSFHNERFIYELNSHGKFWKNLAVFFLSRIDCFVVDNQYCKELVASIAINKVQIKIIPEFIPPLFIPPLQDETILKLREECKFLLSSNAYQISFYDNQDLYGLDILVELVNQLFKYHSLDVGMVFLLPNIGDLEYFDEINRKIKNLGLLKRFCIITEPVEEATSVWQISDIVIRATNTDGNSLTVLEALSVQVPVIASDCSERPQGTILFKTRDVNDLCEKVMAVLLHPKLYHTKLKNIITRNYAEDLLELYRQL